MFRYAFRSELWAYPGKGGWHFVTLPQDMAANIRSATAGMARPWGSLSVEATLGQSRWRTSLFADSKSGSYLLPVKASVRSREALHAGDAMDIAVELPF